MPACFFTENFFVAAHRFRIAAAIAFLLAGPNLRLGGSGVSGRGVSPLAFANLSFWASRILSIAAALIFRLVLPDSGLAGWTRWKARPQPLQKPTSRTYADCTSCIPSSVAFLVSMRICS